MKHVFYALLGATFALSFASGAHAASCEAIGKSVVDQYVAVAGYSTSTKEQAEAYGALVLVYKGTCEIGVEVRNKGATPAQAAAVNTKVMASNRIEAGANSNDIMTRSMTALAYTMGYAYGDSK